MREPAVQNGVGFNHYKHFLLNFFETCLKKEARNFISIDEFVRRFNENNKLQWKRSLNTYGKTYEEYFRGFPEIFHVEGENLYMSSSRSFRTGNSRTETNGHLQMAVSHIGQTRHELLREVKSPNTEKDVVTLTAGQLRDVLVSFAHSLSNQTINLGAFCAQLKRSQPQIFQRFVQRYLLPSSQIDFLLKSVSNIKNVIQADTKSRVLEISPCRGCSDDCPFAVSKRLVPPVRRLSFTSSMARFPKRISFSNKAQLCKVVNCDAIPAQIRVEFILENEEFRTLHEELLFFYRNNIETYEAYVGMPCAVPYEGVKDYHRAVVKDISDVRNVKVHYVDLGEDRDVPRQCIRLLDESFMEKPLFFLSGRVVNSPRFSERLRLGQQLLNQEGTYFKIIKFNENLNCYFLQLVDV